LAPTSTPRVGSSSSSRRGSLSSSLANTTFCWLPPERLTTRAAGSLGRTSKRSSALATSACSAAGDTSPHGVTRRSVDITMFQATDWPRIRPVPRRSSVT